MEKDVKLNRTFGFWSTISMVVGTVIGSGVFFKQGKIIAEAGGTTNALIVWVVSGLLALAGALTLSEIAARVPRPGGIYTYIEEPFGKFWAFIAGWMQVIFYGPALVAAVSYFFASLLLNLIGVKADQVILGIPLIMWTAVVVLLTVSGINLFENSVARRFNIVTTITKIIPIIALIIFGLFFGKENALGQTIDQIASNSHSTGFGLAMVSALFAYDGWAIITSMSGEIKQPEKTLPRALTVGMIFVMLVYLLTAWGVFQSMPAEQIVKYDTDASYYIVKNAFGEFAGRLLTIGILISVLGSLNSKVLAFPRMTYEMAVEDNFIFAKQLKKIGQKTRTPFNAVLFLAIISIIMLFVAGAQDLSDWTVVFMYLFYFIAFVGLFILRKKKTGEDSKYRVPLYPIIPLVAIGGSLFIVGSTILSAVTSAADGNMSQLLGITISAIVIAAGAPIYLYVNRQKK
ncbi:MAG: amino acid permease [Lactobacillaceae bacterium]|nr:amino acid permease [Lactobacillaceae bacterium]